MGNKEEAFEVEFRQDAEDLADGERAGGGWSHAADVETTIGRADRLAIPGLVVRKVLERQLAGIVGMALHGRDDCLGDRSLVEGIRAFGADRAQRLGVGGVEKRRALLERRS